MTSHLSARRRRRLIERSVPRSGSHMEMSDAPLSLRFRASKMVEERPKTRRLDTVCRVLNVTVASAGIVVSAPLMAIIAAAIKLTSRGPVIYSQPRVGLDRRRFKGEEEPNNHRRRTNLGGRIFTIYKFRTMEVSKGPAAQRWSSRDDLRITSVGKLLRATRLDELPQFFNVLRGDMNIVGPRPEQPAIFEELHGQLGGKYRRRQRVLPGITGLAQVNGRSFPVRLRDGLARLLTHYL